MDAERIRHHLDLRGKVCPGPTWDTRMALNEMGPGELLEVVTDYYPAKQTIPMLLREWGYPCALIDEDKPVFRFIIEKVRRDEAEVERTEAMRPESQRAIQRG